MIDYLKYMDNYSLIYDDRIHTQYEDYVYLGDFNVNKNYIKFTDYGQPMLRFNGINIYDVEQIKQTWNAVAEELITRLDKLELLQNKI